LTWTYQQSTGVLSREGHVIFRGYSGKGEGYNNAFLEGKPMIGPLPRGKYTIIGHPFHHPHTGIYSMRLKPDSSNHMFGRSGFLIHGDSIKHPGMASDGCIIMPMAIRHKIWNSGDRSIEVVR
jgi:hypothetical protein